MSWDCDSHITVHGDILLYCEKHIRGGEHLANFRGYGFYWTDEEAE